MSMIGKDYIRWIIKGRREAYKDVRGFYAHWGSLCVDCTFQEYVRIAKGSLVTNSTVGRFTRISSAEVTSAEIGAFCALAQRAVVGGGGDHPLDQVSVHSIFYRHSSHPHIQFLDRTLFDDSLKKTIIGNDVWIGSNSVIKAGVKVGTGAIIGNSALVLKDVPPYAVVGGVPARIIKYRHNDELIAELLRSKWWEWTVPQLQVITRHFKADVAMNRERFLEIEAEALQCLNE